MLGNPLPNPQCEPSDVLCCLWNITKVNSTAGLRILSLSYILFAYIRHCAICANWILGLPGNQERNYNKGLHDLISSPNFMWVIKPRTWRCIGYVVCMTEKRSTYRVWWRNLMERDHLEYLGVDKKLELK